jgi:hypothetical protein
MLSGGITNAGAVFRRGEIVDRPAQPHAPAIHRFLDALPPHGFAGAPRPVGLSDGREQLTFVSGDVALTPYPAWSMTEAALASVGALLRRFHEASSAIPLEPGVCVDHGPGRSTRRRDPVPQRRLRGERRLPRR